MFLASEMRNSRHTKGSPLLLLPFCCSLLDSDTSHRVLETCTESWPEALKADWGEIVADSERWYYHGDDIEYSERVSCSSLVAEEILVSLGQGGNNTWDETVTEKREEEEADKETVKTAAACVMCPWPRPCCSSDESSALLSTDGWRLYWDTRSNMR